MKSVYIYDRDLVPILFPGYVAMDGELVTSLKGEHNYLWVKLPNKADIRIVDRRTAVEFAYAYKGVKKVPKTVEKRLTSLAVDAFITELRYFMALGKWKQMDDTVARVYELFEGLSNSRLEFLRIYFELRKQYSVGELWSSMMTFLIRVINKGHEDSSLSEYYRNVIHKFYNQAYRKIPSLTALLRRGAVSEGILLSSIMELR